MKFNSLKVMLFVSLAALIAALSLVFFAAPREMTMGIVQKIFYFHVASAINMMIFFSLCSVASVVYLIKRYARADALSVAFAEAGLLLGAIVLVTGPLWARKAWGTFWTWEPRLTLSLMIFFLFLGYISLRAFAGSDRFARTVSAGLAVLGLPASYLIHVAVEKWGGNHPQVVYKGGLLNFEMRFAFFASVIAVFLLGLFLIALRYRLEMLKTRIDSIFSEKEDF